jgi:hypothetical protein
MERKLNGQIRISRSGGPKNYDTAGPELEMAVLVVLKKRSVTWTGTHTLQETRVGVPNLSKHRWN